MMHGPLVLFLMRKLQQKMKEGLYPRHYSISKHVRGPVLLAEIVHTFLGLWIILCNVILL